MNDLRQSKKLIEDIKEIYAIGDFSVQSQTVSWHQPDDHA